MKAPLYTQTGEKKGEVTLPAHLFGITPNEHVVHLALLRQHANARLSTAHTLRRGEVRGSTKKGFRQKGTGNARMGDRRSPTRRGGGVAWGPRNDRNFEQDLPKKVRRLALCSALSAKANDHKICVLEGWNLDKPKTKEFIKLKAALPTNRSVLVVHTGNEILKRSARNLAYTKALNVRVLNIHDLLKYDQILFEHAALEQAEKIFTIEKKAEKKAATVES